MGTAVGARTGYGPDHTDRTGRRGDKFIFHRCKKGICRVTGHVKVKFVLPRGKLKKFMTEKDLCKDPRFPQGGKGFQMHRAAQRHSGVKEKFFKPRHKSFTVGAVPVVKKFDRCRNREDQQTEITFHCPGNKQKPHNAELTVDLGGKVILFFPEKMEKFQKKNQHDDHTKNQYNFIGDAPEKQPHDKKHGKKMQRQCYRIREQILKRVNAGGTVPFFVLVVTQ